jgi:phosphatidylglycerol---prolipoprotein diacylglyceryl transferase
MHPILIDFGSWNLPLLGPTHLFLPTYGLLFAIGALCAWWWFVKRAAAIGLPAEPVFNLAFYTLLGGLIGAKLTLILIDLPYYLANPAEILGTVRSAGVLMGGVLLGTAVFFGYAIRKKLPILTLTDAIVAPVALAQAVGRFGCFSAGCCWGVGSDAWWAVRFTSAAAHDQTGVPLNVSLLPVQLIEATGDIVLACILTWVWRRRVRPAGTAFWLYLVLYGALRGTIEFWRGDAVRGLWFGGAVSTSQIFSLAAIAIGLFFLVTNRVRANPAEA